jgi:hypothetical protein
MRLHAAQMFVMSFDTCLISELHVTDRQLDSR